MSADFEAVAGSGSLTVGAQIATLSVTSESGSGSRPFSATVLPLEGEVPSGSHLSNAAGTEAGDIISTHSDGSASVVVFASTASATGTMALHVATGTPHAALTASAIAAQVTSVAAAFGSPYGTASITDFSTPERVWWATSKVICARYRVAAPTPSGSALEAVIDVHAWSGRALVEVVVENAKLAIGSLGVATPKPAAADYTGATVSINGGAAIATVPATGVSGETGHNPFRAWYASGWVGGNPGLRVTQLHTELQQHPLLFKCDQAATFDMAGYASDAYTPWSTGRYRSAGMGGGGDHAQIGPLPQWEARALQSGDRRAWQATEASALSFLGYACQYRDAATGNVPTFTTLKVNNVSQSGYSVGNAAFWPNQAGTTGPMSLEVAHHPAVGLMAFLSRPSPVFIELAQKLAVWNGTWSVVTGGPVTTTGIFGNFYQMRGRAWALRSLAHATFLTPDSHPWKAPAKTSIHDNVAWLDAYRTDSKALLNAAWEESPANLVAAYTIGAPTSGGSAANGQAMWMYHYLLVEMHKAASAKLLTGSAQTAIDTLADWMALQPVRWVNEQANGGWRYITYACPLGRNAATMDSLSTWGAQMDYWYDDAPPATTGTWFADITGGAVHTYAGFAADLTGSQYYPWYFWSALVAAVERGVAGSATAWNTVQNNVTGLDTWRAGFASEPRWGSAPKNPPAPAGFAVGGGTGTFAGGVWTPAKASDGRVYAESWAIVPSSQWVRVAGTEMSTLTAEIVAAGINWDSAKLNWPGYTQSWAGWGIDLSGARVWAFSGGHSDGNNNGLYRFDAYRMAWAVECLPTDRLLQNAEYLQPLSEGTVNYTARAAARNKFDLGTLGHINDLWYDQFITDNRPTARHSYSSLVYDAGRDKLIMPCRRYWEFNRTTGAWDYRRNFADRPYSVDPSTGQLYEYMAAETVIATYDETASEVLFGSTGSNSRNLSLAFRTSDATWQTTYSAPWSGYGQAVDARHGRFLTGFSPPSNESDGYLGLYWRYSLDSRTTVVSGQVQFAGGLTRASFGNYTNDGQSMTWVNSWNKYLCCLRTAAGPMGFFTLDPATTPWTLAAVAMTNAPTTIGSLLSRRMVYFPALDAILLQDLGSTNVYLYKIGV